MHRFRQSIANEILTSGLVNESILIIPIFMRFTQFILFFCSYINFNNSKENQVKRRKKLMKKKQKQKHYNKINLEKKKNWARG